VESVVVEGSAYREILRYAAQRESDLIVMGLYGRGSLDLMVFGSNAQHVIRSASCPVLTVPRQVLFSASAVGST
jgi:nucleotide-binding universal stress UspA family protein